MTKTYKLFSIIHMSVFIKAFSLLLDDDLVEAELCSPHPFGALNWVLIF